MASFDAALVREQGVSFAVVCVKPHVIRDRLAASRFIAGIAPSFPGCPIVLVAQDARGVPTYLGRPDIVRFLANVEMSRIPFRHYSLG